MKKKILIIGSTGMLGHQVYKHFKKNEEKFEIIDITYRTKVSPKSIVLDVTNSDELSKCLKENKPDYVINCVGILISGSNNNIANAIYINAYLPHFLAKKCSEINAKLIHISTDCVFSGQKGKYTEGDEKDGKDTYAKTKGLGEVTYENHVTLRTSIIGPELKKNGEGLLHWFLNQNGAIQGYTKAIWSGVTTYELARFIEVAINFDLNGLYHVTNNESINKYDLLKLFSKNLNKEIHIEAVEGKSVDKSLIDTQKAVNYKIPVYEEMIKEMFLDIKENAVDYKHYNV
ncbi:SDR family oxidoreductase [uncultured Aquimarina sp.]|uniref:dTDP-4-dehydrorhamnose reductase family protein n=1 Tax=uncultured Aquimarina sp. TaxID=575652 RepID=UPI0026274707|nr:SDR family oxidoreductase [uncultured Aquimarina sp.]